MTFSTVPIGSTIVRAYYCVPDTYTHAAEGFEWNLPGSPDGDHAAFENACRFAHSRYEVAMRQIIAGNGGDPDAPWVWSGRSGETVGDYAEHTVKGVCTVDLRWEIKYPPLTIRGGASGLETTIERMNVAHLDDEHWERIAKTRVPA